MKQLIPILSLLLFLAFPGCKKATAIVRTEVTVKYEVITTSGTWFGGYDDELEIRRSIPPNPGDPPAVSGWTYSWSSKAYPIRMHCDATVTCVCPNNPTSPEVTVNIYVDGKIVATQKSNWAKGVTSADYIVQ